MRRQRYRKPVTGVSLFPFLAVLICTMGALIVLLVMVVQQARVHADVIAQHEQPDRMDENEKQRQLREEFEDHEWRREILGKQRAEKTAQVADSRLALSHLEEHIRQLEQQWNRLQAEARQLRKMNESRSRDQQALAGETEQLKSQIAAERQALELAKREAARRPRSYAIIPYKGPNGTQRRPIYIECTAEGVVLQPEGILLPISDFAGPLGPGNPLDAALRSIREYLARTENASQGEPYPLLIVRPDGAMTYSMARAAMKAWDDEFGYELVDGDLRLEFPPPNPHLAEELRARVEEARRRQAILAAAMPSQFGGREEVGFVATSRGGLAPAGGSGQSGRGIGGGYGGAGVGRDRRFREGQAPRAAEATAGAGQEQPLARPRDTTSESRPGNAAPGAKAGNGGDAQSLAHSRGRDWGLRDAAHGGTAVTRPIRVACLADRLILLPERGDSQAPRVVPVHGPMRRDIDQFVSRIWNHMEQWGIALAGGYWKPVLNVEVGPGAEERFAELETLLNESGLVVKRVQR